MFESFIITLREGVEIALIVGLLLIYLSKIGLPGLKKFVFAALLMAGLLSAVIAVILEKLALDFELFEGYLLFVAAVFVTLMVVWMWRTARMIRREIEHRVDSLVAQPSSLRVKAGVFLFAFLMVVREGIETVIFLRAVTAGGTLWGAPLGVVLGAGAAVAFGFLFVKGSMRIDIARFLKVTAVVLLVFVCQLLVNGVHEFYELGVFPASPTMMSVLGPIVRNNLLFVLAIICIPAILFMVPGKKKITATSPLPNRGWQVAAGVSSFSIIFLLGFSGIYASRAEVRISPPLKVYAERGVIHIPVNELLDGNLHRYGWLDEEGIQIRFFALRTPGGSFATAFDACRACFNYGYYYLDGGELICSVCEAPSEMSKLAVATEGADELNGSMEGMGCAPLHLSSKLENGSVLVKVDDLLKNKKYFETSHIPQTVTIIPAGKNNNGR